MRLILICLMTAGLFAQPSLGEFLKERGVTKVEGHLFTGQSREPQFFLDLLKNNPKVRRIAEIGFNAGHSSVHFLKARKNIQVTAFDIMEHSYAYDAKEFIDTYYPGRHTLVEGDSQVSVPRFHEENPDVKFDLIFIDGCHKYEVALNDILNMKEFAHKKTLLVLDDINCPGDGADKARRECVEKGIITEGKIFRHGRHRVWGLCRYIME